MNNAQTNVRFASPLYSSHNGSGSICLLKHDERLVVSVRGAIVDVDDTQVEGSGEEIHNGIRGRFAQALEHMLLDGCGKRIKFTKKTWDPFKACTGKAEVIVCNEIAAIAEQKFDVPIDPHQLQKLAKNVLFAHKDSFFSRVSVVPGIKSLLDSLRHGGVRAAVCSASGEDFVREALQHFDLLQYFETLICSADKKIFDTVFSARSVLKACSAIQTAPSQLCMIGDSLSDYASASLAGIPLVILRLPPSYKASERAKFFEDVQIWQKSQGKTCAFHGPAALVVVTCFSQATFLPTRSPNCGAATSWQFDRSCATQSAPELLA
jgi:phosphoglycolate phosphatase-like HAD superfamily hydrolase